MKRITAVILSALAASSLAACDREVTSDTRQTEQQESILAEGTSQVGMPAIKNFRERKIMKDILELRDQTGLVTFTYLENMNPTPIAGKTALGGKLTFFCVSVGYAIPAATQFTNPQKLAHPYSDHYIAMPQADPNGLFSPSSAEGSWVMCKDPKGENALPTYTEPRVVATPFKLPVD